MPRPFLIHKPQNNQLKNSSRDNEFVTAKITIECSPWPQKEKIKENDTVVIGYCIFLENGRASAPEVLDDPQWYLLSSICMANRSIRIANGYLLSTNGLPSR